MSNVISSEEADRRKQRILDENASINAGDIAARNETERAVVQAIVTVAAQYNALEDLASMQDITIPNLKALSVAKGMPDSEYDALITKLTPFKWQLEAIEDTTWAECWNGLKSRFPEYLAEILQPNAGD